MVMYMSDRLISKQVKALQGFKKDLGKLQDKVEKALTALGADDSEKPSKAKKDSSKKEKTTKNKKEKVESDKKSGKKKVGDVIKAKKEKDSKVKSKKKRDEDEDDFEND